MRDSHGHGGGEHERDPTEVGEEAAWLSETHALVTRTGVAAPHRSRTHHGRCTLPTCGPAGRRRPGQQRQPRSAGSTPPPRGPCRSSRGRRSHRRRSESPGSRLRSGGPSRAPATSATADLLRVQTADGSKTFNEQQLRLSERELFIFQREKSVFRCELTGLRRSAALEGGTADQAERHEVERARRARQDL